MKPFRVNLSVAILSSLALLLLLSWLLLSIISFTTARKDLVAQKNEQARVLLAAFISTLPVPLQRASEASLLPAGRMAATLDRERDFSDLLVVDTHGVQVFYTRAEYRTPDAAMLETLRTGRESYVFTDNKGVVVRYASVRQGGVVVGAARLALKLGREYERLEKSQSVFVAYFILDFLLLFGLGSFMLRRIMVSPILRLLAATERIAAGDYSHPVSVGGSKEIVELAESFNYMVQALRANKEEVERYVASLEDANKALQVAREETIRSEKLASVGVLAAGMAHEIGTPLAAIIGYAGLLKDELASDPEETDYILRIEREAGRIDRLVRELLDYARPRPPEFEWTSIGPFLSDTLDMLARQGLFKRITTELQMENGLPDLFIDRYQLQQVLINLLVNARDAMPGGGNVLISVTHLFQETTGKTFIDIAVQDSGEGILPDQLEKIFDPFFTTKASGKGTGLGLAICARIVEGVGGAIFVESHRGKGSKFTIRLPELIREQGGGW